MTNEDFIQYIFKSIAERGTIRINLNHKGQHSQIHFGKCKVISAVYSTDPMYDTFNLFNRPWQIDVDNGFTDTGVKIANGMCYVTFTNQATILIHATSKDNVPGVSLIECMLDKEEILKLKLLYS